MDDLITDLRMMWGRVDEHRTEAEEMLADARSRTIKQIFRDQRDTLQNLQLAIEAALQSAGAPLTSSVGHD
jgi:hypothetical protein